MAPVISANAYHDTYANNRRSKAANGGNSRANRLNTGRGNSNISRASTLSRGSLQDSVLCACGKDRAACGCCGHAAWSQQGRVGLKDITNMQREAVDAGKACFQDPPKAAVVAWSGDSQQQSPAKPGNAPQHLSLHAALSNQDSSIQQKDSVDAQEVSEYVPDILKQLFAEERQFMPRPNYMESQKDINGKMRSILVDWLIEVHMKYKLRRETLHLSVNILDRYLAVAPVSRKRLQLAGVVSMFLASKFEEIDPPPVSDFVYITDKAYTKNDILQMECSMLSALGFQLVVPTVTHFSHQFQLANRCSSPSHVQLANYILDLALVEIRMIGFAPSELVAAALLLSNQLLGRAMPRDSGLFGAMQSKHAVWACAEEMRALLRAAPGATLQAVRKKYSMPQYQAVASLPCVATV
eukprot:TRINITY_DN65338_c0_g1_i1.p1 TRINITY_DN65338_c0_g1~~TRINITY_DN65338_c0_g1_i1.p1  ORF type:complete len:411 (-),score=74.52 TRINITY_DN65338_c0_g1_i1:97-1329(-)